MFEIDTTGTLAASRSLSKRSVGQLLLDSAEIFRSLRESQVHDRLARLVRLDIQAL
jgi:hypothetical protein